MHLDAELCRRFLAHSVAKGNCAQWVREQRRALKFLAERLQGRDLARLELRVLLEHVDGHRARTATIKALYSYLRKKTFELTVEEDPTFGRLMVTSPRPKPFVDKSLKPAEVRRALRRLRGKWRDLYRLQSVTGIHTSELLRFASGGEVVRYRGQAGAHAFIQVAHKGGQVHRVAVSREVAQCAQRVRARGSFTAEAYHLHVRGAGGFTPGRLRHTVATQLVNDGVDMATVATFLGHRTPQTTKKWYARFAIPRNPMLGRAKRARRR